MNARYQILKTIDTYGTLNFADIFDRANTGQTREALAKTMWNIKNINLVEQHHETKHYSLTNKGAEYLRTKSTTKAKPAKLKPAPKKPAIPMPPAARTDHVKEKPEQNLPTKAFVTTGTNIVKEEIAKPAKQEPIGQRLLKAIGISPTATSINPTPGVDTATVAENYNYNTGNAIECLMDSAHPAAQRDNLLMARDFIDREIARLER